MKSKNILNRLKAALRRVLYRRPGFYAECCCGLRGPRYVGNLGRHHAVELTDFGCFRCRKFALGCWGPRLRKY